MAQPIYFAPGYESPSLIKLQEATLKGQAVMGAAGDVSQALLSWDERKRSDKMNKMATMTALASTYGGDTLGPAFEDDYGKTLATYGVHLPKNDAGLYMIPQTFEEKLKEQILSKPELIPALLGASKPNLSPEEQHHNDQIEQLKRLDINSRIEEANARLKGVEDTIAGRHQDVATTAAAGVDRANISADASVRKEGMKPYAQPSGYYNYKGKLVPAIQIDKHPDQYQGAYPLTWGAYNLQSKDQRARKMDGITSTKADLVLAKLRKDVANDDLKPYIQLIGAAAKTKDTGLQKQLVGRMLNQLNAQEGLEITNDEASSFLDMPEFVKTFLGILGGGSVLTAKDAKKAGDEAAKGAPPPTAKPTTRKLPDGTEIIVTPGPGGAP